MLFAREIAEHSGQACREGIERTIDARQSKSEFEIKFKLYQQSKYFEFQRNVGEKIISLLGKTSRRAQDTSEVENLASKVEEEKIIKTRIETIESMQNMNAIEECE